jgi:hypothetical protein
MVSVGWFGRCAGAAVLASFGVVLLSASGCSSSSDPGGCEPHEYVLCQCPANFEYDSTCGNNRQPQCDECPDPTKLSRIAACEISTCKASNGDPTGTWLFSSACPFAFERNLNQCNAVSAVDGLVVSGQFSIDAQGYASATTLEAKAHLSADQSPYCGNSCSGITNLYVSIYGDTLDCPPGTDGTACVCERNATFVDAQLVVLAGDKLSLRGGGLLLPDFDYCVNGDSLTLSNEEMSLSFKRAACSAGEKSCDGDTVTTCQGNVFQALEPCAADKHCVAGECLPACDPGKTYCVGSNLATCGADGVKRDSDEITECEASTRCHEQAGCVPVETDDFVSKTTDGRSGPAFGGNVIQMKRAATLLGFSQIVGLPTGGTVGFLVYEGTAATGPFQRIFAAQATVGPLDQARLNTPDLSVELKADKYYAIGLQLPEGAELYIAIGGAKDFDSASFVGAALIKGTAAGTSFTLGAANSLEDPYFETLNFAVDPK